MVVVAGEIGAKDKENLGSVLQNADKAVELNAVVDVAAGVGLKNQDSLAGEKGVFQNADKAIEQKDNIDIADNLDLTTQDNLAAVFQNSDQAVKLNDNLHDAEEVLSESNGRRARMHLIIPRMIYLGSPRFFEMPTNQQS